LRREDIDISDLLTGVLIGVALTAITLIFKVSRLNIFLHKNEESCIINIYIEGTATFVQLPKLAGILDRVPPQSDLHLHVDKLVYIDHSCLEFLSTWQKQQEQKYSKVTMPWEKLEQSFYQPFLELYP
jgi:MFS superfamily sulfate permease-like transporter